MESAASEVAKGIYTQITDQFPVSIGKEISKVEREEKGLEQDRNLIYGEMEFDTLAAIFSAIDTLYGGMPATGKFVDLGSGTGKACIAAGLIHQFDSVVGIEIMDGLYNASVEIKGAYDGIMTQKAQEHPEIFPQIPPITFI
jgi:hypothetical protein